MNKIINKVFKSGGILMKLYILSDSDGVIRGITTSRLQKEKIEDEYIELWNYDNYRDSNLRCDEYNLGD
jgi:hypothetical protein